jgi:hypothetical protein
MQMEPIKISMRGLAEVASAKPGRKKAVLKRFKFPESAESVGRSNYYVKALSAIKRHHKGESVATIMSDLLSEAATETDPRKKAKLLNNYRAITDYLRIFGTRQLEIKPGKKLYYTSKDVLINAHPDLVAEENGNLVLVKLNLGKEDFGGGVCALLLHVLYEAAQIQGLAIPPSGVECLQTSSGSRIVGPKRGFPPKSTIDAACRELSSIWSAA